MPATLPTTCCCSCLCLPMLPSSVPVTPTCLPYGSMACTSTHAVRHTAIPCSVPSYPSYTAMPTHPLPSYDLEKRGRKFLGGLWDGGGTKTTGDDGFLTCLETWAGAALQFGQACRWSWGREPDPGICFCISSQEELSPASPSSSSSSHLGTSCLPAHWHNFFHAPMRGHLFLCCCKTLKRHKTYIVFVAFPLWEEEEAGLGNL